MRFRLAYFATHPIQYQAPLLRHLAADAGLDLEVFFYSDFSLREHVDAGYGVQFKWDVPLVEGYRHRFLKRLCRGAGWTTKNWVPARGMRRLLRDGGFQAVWVHGWAHICSLQAIVAARSLGIPILLRGESLPDELCPGRRRKWLARSCQSAVLRRASGLLCIGTANRRFYLERGLPPERLFLMPYAVDNEFFNRQAEAAHPRREALRAELGLEPGRAVILFAGRLTHVKGPDILLEALRQVASGGTTSSPSYLLFIGDGPMRPHLESEAKNLPAGMVRFLGFKNQSELPRFYDLCDVFVLPSRFEPWGLVVNEVMNAGRPAIVSDRVGASEDLVTAGRNGWIFAHDNAGNLARCLQEALADRKRLEAMGERSRGRVRSWDFEADRNGLIAALSKVLGK